VAVGGLHLLQTLPLVDSPRRSALACLDDSGRLRSLELLGDDAEVLAALPDDLEVLAVDAPLVVPDETGRRDVEHLLLWCDAPAFPVSRRGLRQVHGGTRGADLAGRLAAGRRVVETLPELVLRQLAWERAHPRGTPPPPLAEYRAAWLGVRPPRYRPKGAGRAAAPGLRPAFALLADVLDTAGWAPARAPDAWEALHDAARLDALACAYLALRLVREGEVGTVVIGTPERGQLVLPADASLRARLEVNLARLRAEGAVAI
jgi:predicted RNase H-like nuclease